MKNPIVLIFAGILGAIVVFTGVFVMVLSGDSSKTNVILSKVQPSVYFSENIKISPVAETIGTKKSLHPGVKPEWRDLAWQII